MADELMVQSEWTKLLGKLGSFIDTVKMGGKLTGVAHDMMNFIVRGAKNQPPVVKVGKDGKQKLNLKEHFNWNSAENGFRMKYSGKGLSDQEISKALNLVGDALSKAEKETVGGNGYKTVTKSQPRVGSRAQYYLEQKGLSTNSGSAPSNGKTSALLTVAAAGGLGTEVVRVDTRRGVQANGLSRTEDSQTSTIDQYYVNRNIQR